MRIQRRALLKGGAFAIGASFLVPLTEGLIREARGITPNKKRLIVIAMGNGLHEKRYTTEVRSATDWDLPESLAPLAPHRDDLTFLSKFYNPHGAVLHGNDDHTLTVAKPLDPYQAVGGISFDRYVASKFGQDTAFSSIALTTNWFLGGAVISADGPGRPYPAEWNPVRAYETIFGPADPDGEPAEQRLARSNDVLDFLKEDIKTVRGQLAAPEREKMDQYLESVGTLQGQLKRIQETRAACARPDAPVLTAPAAQRDCVLTGTFADDSSAWTGLVDVGFESLKCGMTNVLSLALMTGAPHTGGGDGGVPGTSNNHHDSCHVSDDASILAFDQYWFGHIARLVDKLKATDDGGDRTMFDNTMILVVNTGGGEHHTGTRKHPVLLIGSAGSSLKMGHRLQFEENERALSDVFVTVSHALGIPTPDDVFGDPKICKGVIDGLI